jgi:diguanylate cyclase (GGDEF)-like protein
MPQNAAQSMPIMDNDANSVLRHENAQLRARVAELERLAVTDTLTPLYNQRYFNEELERWCWRAHRYGGTYGLLFCDVDGLKSVNDIQGHSIGDDVLRGVAAALLQAVRKSDVVARIGGDEFTVLLDNISAEQLTTKTASMQAEFGQLAIKTAGPTLKIGVSIGSYPISGNTKPADVMEAADQAMYDHKRLRAQA